MYEYNYMTQRWNMQKRRKLPMAVKANEITYSSPFEKETWVGQAHQPWQATGLGETTLTKNTSPSKSEGTSPHGKE